MSATKKYIALAIVLGLIVSALATGISDATEVPYENERVSLLPDGSQPTTGGIGGNILNPDISYDGRFVAFASASKQFVPDDTNTKNDVFVRDTESGSIVRANVSNSGSQMELSVRDFAMSDDGKFVVFSTEEDDLVSNDNNGKIDVFLRDLEHETTEKISVSENNTEGNGNSLGAEISADGRYVVYQSAASNLVSGDINSEIDIFLNDRELNTTVLISKTQAGTQGNGQSHSPSINCSGSHISFASQASNLSSNDTNGVSDVFLVDRINNKRLTNITESGNKHSYAKAPISCAANKLVFKSSALNLVPTKTDTSNYSDIFAYDINSQNIEYVSVDSSENLVDGHIPLNLTNSSIDFSGRYAVFAHRSGALITGDNNGTEDIFIRDLHKGTTQLVSKRSASVETTATSQYPAISADGRKIIYISADPGLVANDTNGLSDLFVSNTGL